MDKQVVVHHVIEPTKGEKLMSNYRCPLDCKEIQPVHSKGDQSWVFNGRTDTGAETPLLWPPDAKNRLI